jgi:hypothetical protein
MENSFTKIKENLASHKILDGMASESNMISNSILLLSYKSKELLGLV